MSYRQHAVMRTKAAARRCKWPIREGHPNVETTACWGLSQQLAGSCVPTQDLRVAEITMRFNKAWLAENQAQEGDMLQARWAPSLSLSLSCSLSFVNLPRSLSLSLSLCLCLGGSTLECSISELWAKRAFASSLLFVSKVLALGIFWGPAKPTSSWPCE